MISFPKPDVEQFFQSYVIRLFAVSKDEGRIVFSSNLNGTPNLWAMDLPGTYPYPLSYNNENANFIKIDSQGRFILAGMDHDGDESYHMYVLRPEGGVPLKLIPGESTDKFYFSELSEDGERLYYVTSIGNPNFLNTRRFNLRTGEDELLYQGEGTNTALELVSSDETQFIYTKSYMNTHQVPFIVTRDEEFPLLPNIDGVQRAFSFVFVDEDTLLFATDYESEYAYVAKYSLTSRTFEALCHIPNEEVKELKWHKPSGTLYIWTDKGIEDRMYSLKLESKELSTMEMPVDIMGQAVVADSGNIYVLGRGAVQPFNIHRLVAGQWEKLTRNEVIGLSEEDLVRPDVVRYSSFDGLSIEALLFKAKPENANGYTIFWPHGGPQAAEGKSFRSMFQFMLAQGYNIFAPNFRGSTGYGAEFTKMVEGDWGEGPRLDCVAGIEWLFDQGISSADRLFIVGGSYGGYMTLLLAGRHSEYFKAAIDIFGPSNLFTFRESVPEDWKPVMDQWLGNPERDKERMTKDSPITYLEQMVKPMLVIQGANDPRVVKEESDQIVAALQARGVDVEYIVLEDEGHGFSKRSNEIHVYRSMLEFLKKHQ